MGEEARVIAKALLHARSIAASSVYGVVGGVAHANIKRTAARKLIVTRGIVNLSAEAIHAGKTSSAGKNTIDTTSFASTNSQRNGTVSTSSSRSNEASNVAERTRANIVNIGIEFATSRLSLGGSTKELSPSSEAVTSDSN